MVQLIYFHVYFLFSSKPRFPINENYNLNKSMQLKESLFQVSTALSAIRKPLVECAIYATFFIRLKSLQSKSKLIWMLFTSYLHVSYLQTPLIRIICFKIFAEIRIQIFDLMQEIHVATNIRFRANINWSFFHTGKYLLQKNLFRSEYLQNPKQISHISEYSLENIRIQANVR